MVTDEHVVCTQASFIHIQTCTHARTHTHTYTHVHTHAPGASVGISVWYGQPSEVQFTRGGVVAEPKMLEFSIPDQCIWLIHRVSGAKSGTVNTYYYYYYYQSATPVGVTPSSTQRTERRVRGSGAKQNRKYSQLRE